MDSDERLVRSERSLILFKTVAVIVAFGAVTCVLLWYIRVMRDSARLATCTSHLKYIGLAMSAYHDEYGCFPPAYILGKDGRPSHSWRVLLLPYLQHKDVYDRYDFDEPWDGPNNLLLANSLRDDLGSPVFQCSSDHSIGRDGTHFLLVTGPGTLFAGARSSKECEIADGPANTIMVVEVGASHVRWMEPRDLRIEDMELDVNGSKGNSISSMHMKQGANVLLADAHVVFLPNETPRPAILALLTASGGDNLGLPPLDR